MGGVLNQLVILRLAETLGPGFNLRTRAYKLQPDKFTGNIDL